MKQLELKNHLKKLIRYMRYRTDRKLFPSGEIIYWWDEFADDYPIDADVLERWLENQDEH